jgi:hypothetical protein
VRLALDLRGIVGKDGRFQAGKRGRALAKVPNMCRQAATSPPMASSKGSGLMCWYRLSFT